MNRAPANRCNRLARASPRAAVVGAKRTAALSLALLLLIAPGTRADDAAQTLQKALAAFDEAVSASAARDAPRAAQLYRESVAGFEALRAAGVRNAALEFNLGNAYFRLGDLGRAIVHLRRAAELAPRDARIAANLSYARERVTPRLSAGPQARLLERVTFWRSWLNPTQQMFAGIGLGAIGWGLLGGWLWRRRPVLFALGVASACAGAALSGTLLWRLYDDARSPAGVIVGGEQTLRLGRGEGSGAALDRALGPGVELRIVAERAGWFEVHLPDGHDGWLPVAAVERI